MKNAVRLSFTFLLYLFCFAFVPFTAEAELVAEVHDVQILFLKNDFADPGVDEISTTHSKDFRPLAGQTIRFWNVKDSLWLRVPMPSLKQSADEAFLEDPALILHSEYISRADFFLPQPFGGFKRASHGLDISISERSYPSRLPSFSLKGADPEGFVYIKVKTNFPIGFNMTLQEERSFFVSFVDRLGQYVAFYAFLFSLVLLYIFFYFMTGSLNYFIVGVRQLGILVFILSLSGYLQYYFNIPSAAVYITSWLGLVLYIVAAAFLWRRLLLSSGSDHALKFIQTSQIVVCAFMVISMFFKNVYFNLFVVALAFAMEIVAVAIISFKKFSSQTFSVLFVVGSRLAFIVGLIFLFWDMLNRSRDLNVYIFIVALLLDPLFLIYLLIPGSRDRFEHYQQMEEKSAHFEKLSQRDSMTGLYNKANLLILLGKEIARAQSQNTPLAFIMVDIDYFKRFNDTWGHPEGDSALILLAKIIRQSLRENDEAARYGGEEFSVILPGGTSATAALVAERIRKACEVQSLNLGEGKQFTLSLGVAFLRSSDDVLSFIRRADEALYQAKSKGRNRVETII